MGETQYSKGIKISLPSNVCKIRLTITQKQRSTYVMTLHRRWFVFGCFVSSGMCETRSDSKFCQAFFSVFSCGDRRCNSRSLWRYHNTMLWQSGEKERRLPHHGGCHAQDDQDIYYQVCVSKLGFPLCVCVCGGGGGVDAGGAIGGCTHYASKPFLDSLNLKSAQSLYNFLQGK